MWTERMNISHIILMNVSLINFMAEKNESYNTCQDAETLTVSVSLSLHQSSKISLVEVFVVMKCC